MKSYQTKITTTKMGFVHRNYSKGILYAYDRKPRKVFEKGSEAISESKSLVLDRSSFSIKRTQDTIMALINQNVITYSKFVTLTFASKPLNRQEVVLAFKDLSTRYKRFYNEKMRYLYVTEKATSEGEYKDSNGLSRRYTKRWHIHAVIFNARFITLTDMRKLWRYGSVNIKAIDNSENMGLYLMKYVTKSSILFNKKGYVSSLGLTKPVTYYSPELISYDPSECDYTITYLQPLYNKDGSLKGYQEVNVCEKRYKN